LLLYLPGLDGFGISATAQFDDLSSSFEFWRMTVDKHKEQAFSDLVISITKFVNEVTSSTVPTDSPREVILVGESFGGVLALSAAMALTKRQSSSMTLKGLVLVNPATSFDETNWENLVPLLTSLRHLESGNLTPLTLPTPYSIVGSMALAATVPDRSQFSGIVDFILQSVTSSSPESLLSASSDGLSILSEYLSPLLLERRVLNWLPVGTAVVNNAQRLSKLNVPTLIIGGTDDNMLPTKTEVNRLGKLLPDCVKMEVSGAGHFVLDTRVNLTEIILDSHIFPPDAKKEYDPVTDWTLPPDHVVKAVIEKVVVPQRERTSPVFFSTDPITGKRRRGLSHVPASTKPMLIVGNHQLFGQDLGMIISELLEERGIIARGLAHPIALGGFNGAESDSNESKVREQKRRWEFDENSQSLASPTALFSMFGAVKVSPRNFYRLLQSNQTVLLFPGGTKEALHGKDEAYQLFWPEKVDFVRVAAKFNATIVPLSAIGAADSVDIVMDAPDLLKLPFGIGDNLANFTSAAPSARFDTANEDELFIPPLAVPKPFPARHYFLFGKPYDTTLIDPKDQDGCLRAYEDIENEIKQDIQALLEARKDDIYALDGLKRSSYQRFFGKTPPTFPLESLTPSNI
jgi:pimeloyl-ACP methyl ester carboxylesterase/1-acyl-sn-glycerol-3-phosphate acyltransferase